MASLCLNSLVPIPPSSHPRKLTLSSSSSLLLDNNNNNNHSSIRTSTTLKPIVVTGNPPTYVSAPGRTILAGLFSCFMSLPTPKVFFFCRFFLM